MPLLDI